MSRYLMFHEVEDVLIIEQSNEMEAAEAGCRAQCEIANHHGAVEGPLKNELVSSAGVG